MTFRILVTDDLSPEAVDLLNQHDDIDFDVAKGLSPEELERRIVGYDALIVRSSARATAEVIAAADKLRVIGRAGVGVDNINIPAASERGVVVMNTPGANTVATAEHTMALLLALCRNLPQAVQSLREGRWDRRQYKGVEVREKTIGIVGLGRIGRRVARRCRAFGMDVICYDPYLSEERAHQMRIERVSLDELLARSDFITLHAALTSKTRGLIDKQAVDKMKPGVRIINAARGDLIDEAALIEGLGSGIIAGAALDVLSQEPADPDNPLLHMENVLVTPHLAASTQEAQRQVGIQIVDQVIDALHEVDYRNAVNMPAIDGQARKELRPYLAMAESVGSLQNQMAFDAITKLEIGVIGKAIEQHIKPITVSILKGLLEPVSNVVVNQVNAPHVAMERGIQVAQTTGLHSTDYPNLITCMVEWNGGSRTMAATLFSHDEPRIVDVDGFRIDVIPEGTILVAWSHDQPGFIGKVGTLLGDLGINIATWRTGRTGLGELALSFISIDGDVPDEVVEQLSKTPPIERIIKVSL